jgi:ABC-type multidrug transport system permease subunit
MGMMDQTRGILGYVIGISVILLLGTLAFMSSVSIALTSSATVMSQFLIIIALLVGVGAASKASQDEETQTQAPVTYP